MSLGAYPPPKKRRDAMSTQGIETYHEGDQWKSQREGSHRAFPVGGTKAEQSAKGKTAAKSDGVEHIIKKLDGTIGEKNSYGHDPHPPQG